MASTFGETVFNIYIYDRMSDDVRGHYEKILSETVWLQINTNEREEWTASVV
jgi:hypothetical protein